MLHSRGSKAIWPVLIGLGLIVVVSRFPIHGVDAGKAVQPQTEVILDLQYGSGPGMVGKASAGEMSPGSPAMCPAMFQVTGDGTTWILDTLNSRVVAYKNGRQTTEISTVDFQKNPSLFGVTKSAVWIAGITNGEESPVFSLLRYDIGDSSSRIFQIPLADGARMDPQRIAPIGSNEDALLISGVSAAGQQASIVLNDDGSIATIQQGNSVISGANGSIWRFQPVDNTQPTQLPFSMEKYNFQNRIWESAVTGVLPRRAELSDARPIALIRPVGVDQEGRTTVILYEGKPLSLQFIRTSVSGSVIGSVILDELGGISNPGKYFAPEHYQLQPDGSILMQDTTPDHYRVVRITF